MRIYDFIELTIFALIIIIVLNVNLKTRGLIKEWARDNELEIIAKKYQPWYWAILWLAGGIHPANFKVLVQGKNSPPTEYLITGGGFFWLSDKNTVKKIKELNDI